MTSTGTACHYRLMTSADLATPGKRLRFLREAHGLTQKGLAAKVYATQPAVSQWENDLWLPTKQTQVLLAEALNTTRSFLFDSETTAEVA